LLIIKKKTISEQQNYFSTEKNSFKKNFENVNFGLKDCGPIFKQKVLFLNHFQPIFVQF
jgi:hypothetical protein